LKISRLTPLTSRGSRSAAAVSPVGLMRPGRLRVGPAPGGSGWRVRPPIAALAERDPDHAQALMREAIAPSGGPGEYGGELFDCPRKCVFVRRAVADHQGGRIRTGSSPVGAESFEGEAVAGGASDDVAFGLAAW
jgi:hypothetical protein